MEHSKTPWRIGAMESGQAAIDSADGKEVTGFIDMEDARRILMCVNACAGIRIDALERRMHAVAAEGDTISLLNAQLATERASLFAENQRKQQLEQQVAELLLAMEKAEGERVSLGNELAETETRALKFIHQFNAATDLGREMRKALEQIAKSKTIEECRKIACDALQPFRSRAVIQKVRGGE